MQERHINRFLYFSEQEYTTKNYVIPFIKEFLPIKSELKILEIGCGEGGNIKPFLDLGCKCVGIDLNNKKIELAKSFFENHKNKANLEFLVDDIYKVERTDFQFDLIILRDVIEHIPNQEKFMNYVKKFLKPNGKIFFGFPPWQNPFGGHQQICKSKLSIIPFIHLLPTKIYKNLLEFFGENTFDNSILENKIIDELLEIKKTGISIERFKKIVNEAGFVFDKAILYLINPNYEIKFKLKPRKLPKLFASNSLHKKFLYNCILLSSRS